MAMQTCEGKGWQKIVTTPLRLTSVSLKIIHPISLLLAREVEEACFSLVWPFVFVLDWAA